MNSQRTTGWSPKARRLLLLERLEDRYAPATGLLAGIGLDSLLPVTLAPVVSDTSSTIALSATSEQTTSTSVSASTSTAPAESTGGGLLGALLTPVSSIVQDLTTVVTDLGGDLQVLSTSSTSSASGGTSQSTGGTDSGGTTATASSTGTTSTTAPTDTTSGGLLGTLLTTVTNLVGGQQNPPTTSGSGSPSPSTGGTGSGGSTAVVSSDQETLTSVAEQVPVTVTEGTSLLNNSASNQELVLSSSPGSTTASGSTSGLSSTVGEEKASVVPTAPVEPSEPQAEGGQEAGSSGLVAGVGTEQQPTMLSLTSWSLAGSLGTAPGIPMTALASSGVPSGNGSGLPVNQSAYLPGSMNLLAGSASDSWAGATMGPGQAMLSSWPQGMGWWSLSGSAQEASNGLRDLRAEMMASGEESPALVTESVVEQEPLAPQSAGLVQAGDDLGAMERAFQDFLTELAELRQAVTSWLGQVGPLPWVLMGLAVTATVCEETARRRRHGPRSARFPQGAPLGMD